MSWSLGTVYTKPWFWRKGNRVSTESDSITIQIGGIGDDEKDDCCDDSSDATATSTPPTKNKQPKKQRKKPNKKTLHGNNKIKSNNYTLVTFLPKNLLEQFRRIANFYFLVMTTIAMVIDSPVSPMTSLVPLVFVVSVTAVKQGYEDYLRYKADNIVNQSFVTVIRKGVEIDIKCENILEGDLVKASRDCDVPCDLLLLKSSDPHGKCFITTANLDGETNLKTLFVPKGFPNDASIEDLDNIGCIECERPLADLYTFNGRLKISPMYFWHQNHEPSHRDTLRRRQRTLPLTADHLLLRGSRIKNTEWAIGCAVYTGQNTKLAINSQIFRTKMSSSEKYINKFLVFFLVVLIALVTFCYFMKSFYNLTDNGHDVYLGRRSVHKLIPQFFQEYFSFLILFNYLIPISLYVTIELHKFVGSLFLEWDRDLYDMETNQQCLVNTSNLNEELGQIKILFSDKTGTLTKNEMILKQCSINGKKYKICNIGIQEESRPNVLRLSQYNLNILDFFQALSVCHTVQVADSDKDPENNDDLEKTFEIIESTTTLVDIEEDTQRKVETRKNTKRNEINKQDNLLDNDSAEVAVVREHKRTESLTNSGRKISFNLANKVFPLAPERPTTLSTFTSESRFAFPSPNLDFSPKTPSPLTLNHFQPLKVEYKRTNSTQCNNVLPDRVRLGHRRTQSYSTPSTHTKPLPSNNIRKIPYNRSSSNIANTREYYAAPAYNEATLLERKVSMRNSVRLTNVIEQLDYQASSPDEKALVEGCAKVGFLFTGEINTMLKIQLQNRRGQTTENTTTTDINFERLHTLEFTSDRKRMSAIIRDPFNQIWLYTKGAESHVFPLCQTTPEQQSLMNATQIHIDDYAKVGLRTLAVARRRLTLEEYISFSIDITNASNSLANRKTLVEEVQCRIEKDLELLGATAVEDALQDNVKDTLESLRHAGIMVWVLTGDKIETALNIAKSCGHIAENTKTYFITECKEEFHIHEHLNMLAEELTKCQFHEFSLLIDGTSLGFVMKYCSRRFRDLAVKCHAVLCCRLSPFQKCEVVQLMKTLPDAPITAAIGDGANDVSMIQEAHVGLGIVGKEGRQAARCADYSFANFCMLKKLLLVHGHFYTHRLSLLVLYFFYKNLLFMLIQVYFQTNNRFSTETIYEPIFLTFYNVMYTSLPILLLSFTEKPYDECKLMTIPSLYKVNAGNKRLTWKYFIGWISLSIYHSLVVYLVGYVIWCENNAILVTPHTADLDSLGTFMIHNVVFVVTIKIWLVARYQTLAFILTILGSLLAFMTSTAVYNFFYMLDGKMLWVYNHLLASITFWISCILIWVAALLPDYTIIALKMYDIKFRPTNTVANGWSRLFKNQHKSIRKNSQSICASESTYL